ncbi:hypothetical protein JOD54_004666 [Actinokineospora baliensis]|uniref:hypothetical protein n=1 Tax=Actinokineospora baliensis TaxID=547056 RepID=UPI00195682AB|nr:hypothetical protein [Actinokineospora baliensis]MBM7774462.1 hypothetical protein [Actinokineospora baliensis]
MKKFATAVCVAAAFVFLGAGTAQATNPPPSGGGVECTNSGVINAPVLSCNNASVTTPLHVDFTVDRVLSDNEVGSVETALKNITFNAGNIKNVTKTVVDACGAFSPAVTVGKVLFWVTGVPITV